MNLSSRLAEVRGLHVWIFPTGYGKTRAILHSNLRGVRVIHVLPLQAIVSQLAEDLRRADFDVCYQMAMALPEVCKSPYYAARYNVTTLDSFILNMFGIPVHEIYRENWHSDVAWLMASYADFVIFDEYHLMVAPDGDGDVSKIHTAVIAAVRALRERGLAKRILVLTATMTPSMAASLEPDKVLVYAAEEHDFVDKLRYLVGREKVEAVPPSDQFGEKMRDKLVGVELLDPPLQKIKCGQREIEIPDVKGPGYLAFNSWRRAALAWREGGREGVLIHGKMDLEARNKLVRRLSPETPLYATQVVEAGVDISYKQLISEPAPAFSLIQRAGRVSRRPSDEKGRIKVLKNEKLAEGVYDVELTRKTLDLLQEHQEDINWKVPAGGYDYLRLLNDLDDLVRTKISNEEREVNTFLSILDEIIISPEYVLRKLDQLQGSLVRSSALVTILAGGRQIPIDVTTLKNIAKEVYVVYDKGKKPVETKRLYERPLSTMLELGPFKGVELPEGHLQRLNVDGVEAVTLKPC